MLRLMGFSLITGMFFKSFLVCSELRQRSFIVRSFVLEDEQILALMPTLDAYNMIAFKAP